MSKGIVFSLSMKFTLIILLSSLFLGGIVVFASYQIFNREILAHYTTEGETVTSVAGSLVNWNSLEKYLETEHADEEYERILSDLRVCNQASEATYVYVIIPNGNDIAFIYDTDEEDTKYAIGETVTWETEFSSYADKAKAIRQIGPAFFEEENYGSILSYYTPFFKSDGTFAGYLGIDYNIDALNKENETFITRLALATILISLLITLFCFFIFRKFIVEPVNTIAQAANEYLSNSIQSILNSNSITKLDIRTGDELEELSESLKTMEKKIQSYLRNLELANHRAETDSLTGILNRSSFRNQVETILRNADSNGFFVFMMIDIDKFKEVNDTYGHKAGDRVLVACAQAIKDCFRSDDLVARLGGDEFSVFYQSPVNIQDIEARAQRIGETVSALDIVEDTTITLSIGIVAHNIKDRTDYQMLYHAADEALYEVKKSGRNGYKLVFSPQRSSL